MKHFYKTILLTTLTFLFFNFSFAYKFGITGKAQGGPLAKRGVNISTTGGLLSARQTSSLTTGNISILINGMENGAIATQGDSLWWEISLPVGGESYNEVWFDANRNSLFDVDDIVLHKFMQKDGEFNFNENFLPDLDGTQNGKIFFKFKQGLAPLKYFFVAYSNTSADTSAFEIKVLPNPVATVYGRIILPPTMPPVLPINLSNIIVEASLRDSGQFNMPSFWEGVTDDSGKYVIGFDQYSVSKNPWDVRLLDESIQPWIASPRDTLIMIAPNKNVQVNFKLFKGIVVTGRIVDKNSNQPIHDARVFAQQVYSTDPPNNNVPSNANGDYYLSLSPGKYIIGFSAPEYEMQFWNGKSAFFNADTLIVQNADTIKNINAYLKKGIILNGRLTANKVGIQGAVFAIDTTTKQPVSQTFSSPDGFYALVVSPGVYWLGFFAEGYPTMFWKQKFEKDYPFTPVIVKATDTLLHGFDNDFSNQPPMMSFLKIIKILDVPNDQGKQVFCTWYHSDSRLMSVAKYSVWRRDGPVWTFVANVPARADTLYNVVVPTLFDSTRGFIPFSKFQVTAHYNDGRLFTSAIDSGYSVDNLIPNTPGGFNGVVAENKFRFKWNHVENEDFQYYAIYRSLNKDFKPSVATLYKTTIDSTFIDENIQSGVNYYYYLTAIDFNANESKPTHQLRANTATGVTGVGDEIAKLPISFELKQNYPNPFNPTTIISFALPEKAKIKLVVYNTLGQTVQVLVDKEMDAGSYSTTFNSKGISAGIYYYKLSTEKFTSSKKMIIAK